MGKFTRRQFLGAAAGLSVVGVTFPTPAGALTINPRSAWAGSGYQPKGPLENEDVRFLIVHHSASKNGHTAAQVPGIIRGWFDFHTGPEKGWPDIAYNFIIDSEGGVWEARKGSIEGAIRGSATGGNQGFSQLVCVIGDFNSGTPTSAALSSLVRVLAWLADKHGLATAPGSTTKFTSMGSNKWPAGAEVTTPTIVGHRDMSNTTCPGDNLYPYVVGGLMADVEAVRGGASPAPTTPPTTAAPTTTTTAPSTTTTTAAPTTTTAPPTTTSIPPSTTTTVASTTTAPPPSTTTTAGATTSTAPLSATTVGPTTTVAPTSSSSLAVAAPVAASGGGSGGLVVAGVAVAAVAGLVVWRQRRMG